MRPPLPNPLLQRRRGRRLWQLGGSGIRSTIGFGEFSPQPALPSAAAEAMADKEEEKERFFGRSGGTDNSYHQQYTRSIQHRRSPYGRIRVRIKKSFTMGYRRSIFTRE